MTRHEHGLPPLGGLKKNCMPRFSTRFEIASFLIDLELLGVSQPPSGPYWDSLARFQTDDRGPADLLVRLNVVDQSSPMEAPLAEARALDAKGEWKGPLPVPRLDETWEGDRCRFVVPDEMEWTWVDSVPSRAFGWCLAWDMYVMAVVRSSVEILFDRRLRGLRLHASAVAGPNGAVVFVGPSEIGKSTAAKYRPEGTWSLSDDSVALAFDDNGDGAWVAGLPGRGDLLPTKGSAPVRRLVLLEQADRDELVPISKAEAIQRIAVQTSGWDEARIDIVMEVVEKLQPQVLRCRDKGRFWPLLQADCLGTDMATDMATDKSAPAQSQGMQRGSGT